MADVIETLVDGGKASAGPPLGPALGPMGVNIGQVIAKINEKTASFAGMKVPVKVKVNKANKTFEIEVGTPPTSALIKKEAGVEKGSGSPKQEKVADLLIEQIIKIAKMKEDSLQGVTLKEKIKEVIGTCNSMGVMVEGVEGKDAIKLVNEGKFDKEIKSEKTELSAEEKAKLTEEKDRLQKEMETRKVEFESKAKQIVESMAGKPRSEIKAKLKEAGIPEAMIKELLPVEAAPGAKPAAGAAPAGAAAAKK